MRCGTTVRTTAGQPVWSRTSSLLLTRTRADYVKDVD
jgi:hypothetical protein